MDLSTKYAVLEVTDEELDGVEWPSLKEMVKRIEEVRELEDAKGQPPEVTKKDPMQQRTVLPQSYTIHDVTKQLQMSAANAGYTPGVSSIKDSTICGFDGHNDARTPKNFRLRLR